VERNNRNILILGVLILIVLIVGYYLFLLSPIWTRYDDAVQERSDKEAQLSDLQQQVSQLEQAQKDAPTTERQLLELSKRIPTQPEIPTLVVQVEEIADASGVTQISLVPGAAGPPPGGGNFSVVPITMSFEGTYDQLENFLLRTRNLARLVTVNEVSYCRIGSTGQACPVDTGAGESTSGTGTETQLKVEIKAEVYFQPSGLPSGTAPVAPTAPQTTTAAPGGETTGAP
jgi:type IV pilus assembly protein PilO